MNVILMALFQTGYCLNIMVILIIFLLITGKSYYVYYVTNILRVHHRQFHLILTGPFELSVITV